MVESTITDLIDALNQRNICYAIARNYETYPKFDHDVDLYFDSSKRTVGEFEVILENIARRNGWAYIVRFMHAERSACREHNIEVYCLYDLLSQRFLQIDLFHGFLVWGLPLFNSDELLVRREYDQQFYRIQPAIENLMRLFQINSLIDRPNTREKVQRYRMRVLNYYKLNQQCFMSEVRDKLSTDSDSLLSALLSNNLVQYKNIFQRAKRRLFVKLLMKQPLKSIQYLLNRLIDYLYLYLISPWGGVLDVCCLDKASRQSVLSVLDSLVRAKFIPSYKVCHGFSWLMRFKHAKYLERGGLIVRFHRNIKDECIRVYEKTHLNEIVELIFSRLTRKQKIKRL